MILPYPGGPSVVTSVLPHEEAEGDVTIEEKGDMMLEAGEKLQCGVRTGL